MTETVVEQVELEAPAEEAFEFLSDTENFYNFVKSAEISRRVDLSRSSWLLKGPEGATVEYESELLSKYLMGYRNRLVHGDASRASESDAILDRGELEFERRPDGTTLLSLTYLMDHADLVEKGSENRYTSPDDCSVNLDLVVIVSNLFHPPGDPSNYSSGEEPATTLIKTIKPASVRDRSTTPEEPGASGAGPESGTGDGLISLLDEWAAENPAYDKQTLPALKENLDRNRPEYRKLFGRR
jgi:hypothetical protein